MKGDPRVESDASKIIMLQTTCYPVRDTLLAHWNILQAHYVIMAKLQTMIMAKKLRTALLHKLLSYWSGLVDQATFS
jgi:hypothetical protein